MPFWAVWFIAGLLTAGVAAHSAAPTANSAGSSYYAQNFDAGTAAR